MAKLVDENIFKAVHIVDYQAVCFKEKKTTNPATMLMTVNYFISFYCYNIFF